LVSSHYLFPSKGWQFVLVLQTPFIISNEGQAHPEDYMDLTVLYIYLFEGEKLPSEKEAFFSLHWLVRMSKRQTRTTA